MVNKKYLLKFSFYDTSGDLPEELFGERQEAQYRNPSQTSHSCQ